MANNVVPNEVAHYEPPHLDLCCLQIQLYLIFSLQVMVVKLTPVIFIAGRPKAALLFWFFGDFRCGALLFMVIHVIYKYKNR